VFTSTTRSYRRCAGQMAADDTFHVVYTQGGDTLEYRTWTNGTFSAPTVLATNALGGGYSGLALALDAAGGVHIVFRSTNWDLRYISNAAGTWSGQQAFPGGNVNNGGELAVVIDAAGKAHVMSAAQNAANGSLRYSTNRTGSWVGADVDSGGGYGRWPSMGIDSNGSMQVSFSRMNRLRYGVFDGARWHFADLQAVPEKVWFSSLAADSKGNVHLGYTIEADGYGSDFDLGFISGRISGQLPLLSTSLTTPF
jgi:hypothetical protein